MALNISNVLYFWRLEDQNESQGEKELADLPFSWRLNEKIIFFAFAKLQGLPIFLVSFPDLSNLSQASCFFHI